MVKPMIRASLLLLIALAVVVNAANASSIGTALPETSAARIFDEWLTLADHPTREATASFIQRYRWSIDIDQEMRALTQDGGYEVVAIEESKPQVVVARLKSRIDGSQLLGKIVVDGASHILFLGLYDNSAMAAYEAYSLAADANRVIVNAVRKNVEEKYVLRDVGLRISKALASKVNAGAYDRYGEGELLAEAVNRDLQEVSHDPHLTVNFYLVPPVDVVALPTSDPQKSSIGLAKHNCGFIRVEHIEPNIGYVRLDNFSSPDSCGETASAAMRFVGDSDALIFDLRENGGGVPGMVAYLETYLFDKSTHLNDIHFRKNDEVHQFWTLPYVPGKRMPIAPVFVLTSKNTFSAAEEFAYTLQALKRATIVGETSAGGAHPYDTTSINRHFTVDIPFARSINPITGKDWEGTGVLPDHVVKAEDALTEALSLARASAKKQ
jgi:hypothetical protein